LAAVVVALMLVLGNQEVLVAAADTIFWVEAEQ
jgi:hypothetical protein